MPSTPTETGQSSTATTSTRTRPYQFPKQRQAEILQVIGQSGRARTAELAAHLAVSYHTVSRDLDELNRLGHVIKIPGGAVEVLRRGSQPDPTAASPRASAVHDMMADHAASLVLPGTTIAITEGVTAIPLARRLLGVPGLTVMTNSIPVSSVFAHQDGLPQAVLTGGVRGRSGALVGPLAETLVRSSALHQCFLCPYGMKQRTGFTAADLGEAALNRALIDVADTTVILADHERWNMAGIAVFGALSIADVLISDRGLPPAAVRVIECEVDDVSIIDSDASADTSARRVATPPTRYRRSAR